MSAHTKLGAALLTATGWIATPPAQAASCVKDAPNSSDRVNAGAHMPRPWASTNNVYVDPEDHVWVFDRCEDKSCAGSSVAPNCPPTAR